VTVAAPLVETVNGRLAIRGWRAELGRAQWFRADVRIRHDDDEPCRDCLAARGQLHVFGCTVETCPGCKGQMFGCACAIARAVERQWREGGR
jgi:hypothetical protein